MMIRQHRSTVMNERGIAITKWQEEEGNKTNTAADVSGYQVAPHVFSLPLGKQSPSTDITIRFG